MPVNITNPNEERERLEGQFCPIWASDAVRHALWSALEALPISDDTEDREAAYEALCAPVEKMGRGVKGTVAWEQWWRHGAQGGKPMHMDDREQAPYMAVVQASRVSHGHPGGILFDSEHGHQHYIQLRIHSAYRDRGLSNDWVHADKELIEVSMSEAQWAAMISTLNHGSGTPCTINHILHCQPPVKPELPDDRTSLFKKEMAETHNNLLERLDGLMQGRLTKSQVHELEIIKSHLKSNSSYVAVQFDEHMAKRKAKYQAEIEASMNYAVSRLGMEALAKQLAAPDTTLDGTAEDAPAWLDADIEPPKTEDDF